MNKKILVIGLSFLLLLSLFSSLDLKAARAASQLGEKTLVLYDAASGDIPDTSVIGFTAFPPEGASLNYEDGSTVIDTSISGTDTYAGWVAGAATTDGFPILDSTVGFQVKFTLQVESEIHESGNRSGFSVIILDNNAKGIEMSFWQNEIWVQHDGTTGGLFTHGEGVAFDTTSSMVDYQITIIGNTYTLTANAQPLLTESIRDYSAFDRFPDPYETPNFLFLGDDTTSAQARARLRFLSITGTEPVTLASVVTSTNTGSPEPVVTATPVPSVTPVPSPTPVPVNPVSNLCPSGWLFAVVMFGNVVIINRIKLIAWRH